MGELSRRQFLEGGAAAAALAAFGRPLMADGDGRPYAVADMDGALAAFTPAKGEIPERGTVTCRYAAWRWAENRKGISRNVPAGSMTITRHAAAGAVAFEVAQERRPETLNATITCGKAPEAGLREWSLRWEILPVTAGLAPLATLEEKGRIDAGKVVTGEVRREIDGPICAQWMLPEIVRRLRPREPFRFDLLQDCSLLKPGHAIRQDGAVHLHLPKGGDLELESYVQTGPGILPTHHLIDPRGRVQLISSGLISWTLASIKTG